MAASRADEGQAALQIYDVPADCGMVRRREVPVDAKLRVDIYPKQWVAGSAEAKLYPQALEGGHDAGLGYSVIRVHVDTGVLEHPAFEVLAAPTADGSHGRVRLDMRIELLREPATPENPHDVVRTDVISGELDVEVCGDWAEPKPFR